MKRKLCSRKKKSVPTKPILYCRLFITLSFPVHKQTFKYLIDKNKHYYFGYCKDNIFYDRRRNIYVRRIIHLDLRLNKTYEYSYRNSSCVQLSLTRLDGVKDD